MLSDTRANIALNCMLPTATKWEIATTIIQQIKGLYNYNLLKAV